MSMSLDDINQLSDTWGEEVDNAPTAASMGLTSDPEMGRRPMLPSGLLEKGIDILHLYQAELAKAPGDSDIETGLINHLYQLAFLHYSKIVFSMVKRGKSAEDAEQACAYLKAALDIDSDPRCSVLLGHILERVGFNASAIHWYEETERQVQVHTNFAKQGMQAKTARLSLQAAGKITDPPFTDAFPTKDTPGIIVSGA